MEVVLDVVLLAGLLAAAAILSRVCGDGESSTREEAKK